jgi:hypothetical protein
VLSEPEAAFRISFSPNLLITLSPYLCFLSPHPLISLLSFVSLSPPLPIPLSFFNKPGCEKSVHITLRRKRFEISVLDEKVAILWEDIPDLI